MLTKALRTVLVAASLCHASCKVCEVRPGCPAGVAASGTATRGSGGPTRLTEGGGRFVPSKSDCVSARGLDVGSHERVWVWIALAPTDRSPSARLCDNPGSGGQRSAPTTYSMPGRIGDLTVRSGFSLVGQGVCCWDLVQSTGTATRTVAVVAASTFVPFPTPPWSATLEAAEVMEVEVWSVEGPPSEYSARVILHSILLHNLSGRGNGR